MVPEFILARIKAIQKELDDLTTAIAAPQPDRLGRPRLKGIWRGMIVDESDFKSAAESMFKSAPEHG